VWEGGFDEAAWGAAGGLSETCLRRRNSAPNAKTNLSKTNMDQQERLEYADLTKSLFRLSPAKLHISNF